MPAWARAPACSRRRTIHSTAGPTGVTAEPPSALIVADVATACSPSALNVAADASVIAAPLSTIDPACPTGEAIPIEERSPLEVVEIAGARIAPDGIRVRHPAFDVTPAALVSALVTERGGATSHTAIIARQLGIPCVVAVRDVKDADVTVSGVPAIVATLGERIQRDVLVLGVLALVGDSTYDLATAKNAGLEFFGVTTGTHSEAELRAAGAERVFAGMGEVAAEFAK